MKSRYEAGFFQAIKNKDLATIKSLLKSDPSLANAQHEYTPVLFWASQTTDKEIFKTIITYANPKDTPEDFIILQFRHIYNFAKNIYEILELNGSVEKFPDYEIEFALEIFQNYVNNHVSDLESYMNKLNELYGAQHTAFLSAMNKQISGPHEENLSEKIESVDDWTAARDIYNKFVHNTSVTKLDLSGAKLGELDSEFGYISKILESNKTLKELNLSDNDLQSAPYDWDNYNPTLRVPSENQTAHLASKIKKNSTLEKLDLSNNNLGSEGLVNIAYAIRYQHSLTSLNLANTSLNEGGDKGLGALAIALGKNAYLKKLDLRNNNLTDEDFGKLKLWGAQGLKVVKINNISQKAIDYIGDDIVVINIVDEEKSAVDIAGASDGDLGLFTDLA